MPYCFIKYDSSVFRWKNQVVQQYSNIVAFVNILTHSTIFAASCGEYNPQRLKRQGSQIDNQQLTILENNLRGLNSGYGGNLLEKGFNLSPREIEIATLIRQGIKTKQIALTLNIATETVESHRKNIRKKVGIANADDNLTNYLQTL